MHLLIAKMERRKEYLNEIKLCRFCLTKDSSLSSLYDRSKDPTAVNLPLKIMACVSIEVFPSDKMLSYICERCRTFMDICYDFKQICRRADESCLQFVQSGVPITGIQWPSQLAQIFSLAKRARLINTVIDGSASIEISSRNASENEEDDETYNIDTSGGSTQSVSGRQSTAAPKKAVVKGVMVRVRRRSSGQRTWPCEKCDNSYSLHQLLEIHKAQKHRTMNLRCKKCDANFFSIYDLLTHTLRHKNSTPFQCSACDSKFKRMILLKRHEKIAHSSLPRHLCPRCPAIFLTTEELEAHKKRHVSKFSPDFVCTLCDRKFHTKETLHRHRDIIHGRNHFSCEYCPQRFPTVAKLSRHVRSHAGDRAYPCKHCNKSFLKFRHYTRHLRVKHVAEIRKARGTAEFRCEQCTESFDTQDELYYHSAIHATENLICPLCQEKFENVDAVTTHIRTHVNGIEFMCEYCELVFTTKDKLDAHTNAAHDDEITQTQELDDSSEAEQAEVDGDVEADADVDDDDEDNGLNVKEVGDHMVVEISKADGYMLRKNVEERQINLAQSEDSEMEATYPEVSVVVDDEVMQAQPSAAATRSEATSSRASRASIPKNSERVGILRKAEAIKRRANEKEVPDVPQKKDRVVNVDSTTNIAGSSVKSLRLLEQELQDLARTNLQADAKAGEAKSKRQPVHTSTSKQRPADEKRSQAKQAAEMKAAEQRSASKGNKELKQKEARNTVSSSKEDKNVSSTKDDNPGSGDKNGNKINNKNDPGTNSNKDKVSALEKLVKKAAEEVSNLVHEYEKTKEPKTKGANTEEQPSSSKSDVGSTSHKTNADSVESTEDKEDQEPVRNGDTSSSEDNVIRRSTRPSKIKNYANMIRDRTRMIRDEDDDQQNSDDDEVVEFKEADSRTPAARRIQPKRQKPTTPLSNSISAAFENIARRRGRPRKAVPLKDEESQDVVPGDDPANKPVDREAPVEMNSEPAVDLEPAVVPGPAAVSEAATISEAAAISQSAAVSQSMPSSSTSPTSTEPKQCVASSTTLVSPTGLPLKKVSAQALPPGVKPLPLSLIPRPGDLCSMQIGKKVVKVQKIIMTKTEVEVMAKKGLLELKDGTMVLKQGVKLPPGDPSAALRAGLESLVSAGAARKLNSVPTRCTIDGEGT